MLVLSGKKIPKNTPMVKVIPAIIKHIIGTGE
jgi:hypothetical protein